MRALGTLRIHGGAWGRARAERHRGFSLIEVVLALVIVAIAASGMFVYTQGLMRGSSEPLAAAQALNASKQEMEALVAEYSRYTRGLIGWDEFDGAVTDMQDAGVVTGVIDLTQPGEAFAGSAFAVLEVTIGQGGGSLSAVFSE